MFDGMKRRGRSDVHLGRISRILRRRAALRVTQDATAEELVAVSDMETVGELYQSRIITTSEGFVDQPQPLPDHFPLQTMVMNLTNQCNLSCQYCYEFGED